MDKYPYQCPRCESEELSAPDEDGTIICRECGLLIETDDLYGDWDGDGYYDGDAWSDWKRATYFGV